MMSEKSWDFKDAPPINPPSTSLLANISFAEPGLTLPPYNIGIFEAKESEKLLTSFSLINLCMPWA